MINSKAELKDYLIWDAKANRRTGTKCKPFDDRKWKFNVLLRKTEYYYGKKQKSKLFMIPFLYYKLRLRRIEEKLNIEVPINVIDKGFSLAHTGALVISGNSKIGKNFRVHESVNIGATNGSDKAPIIGDNVFVGTGAKIIGEVTVADGVCIGANAVVVNSITEPDTTWGGIPAKKLSDNSSRSNLSPLLFE